MRARLARARVARIADLVDAPEACVLGTVRATKVLFSPGRGAPCVAYRYRDSGGHDEHREVVFELVDESGTAVIDPSNVTLAVTIREGIGFGRSFVGARYLANRGHPGTHVEQCIEVGQQLYVLGACTRELDPRSSDGMYRDGAGSRLRFAARDDVPLVLADTLQL